jgi:hypothetical protein
VAEVQEERFTTWSGRVMGGIGLAVVAVALVLGVVGSSAPYHPAAYPIIGLFGLLFWATLVRPAVAVEGQQLMLRSPLSTVRVPLAAIERLAVGQYLAVRVADRRFTCTGVGRSHRQSRHDDRKADASGQAIADLSYGAIVERRIQKLAEDARAQQGITLYSDEQAALGADVRRERAWIEIGLLAVLAVAVVVTLFV